MGKIWSSRLKLGNPSDHRSNYSEESNDWLRVENLDFLEEDREMAHIWSIDYEEKIKKCFDKQAYPRDFRERDLILRKSDGPKKEASEGKMVTN